MFFDIQYIKYIYLTIVLIGNRSKHCHNYCTKIHVIIAWPKYLTTKLKLQFDSVIQKLLNYQNVFPWFFLLDFFPVNLDGDMVLKHSHTKLFHILCDKCISSTFFVNLSHLLIHVRVILMAIHLYFSFDPWMEITS